MTFDQSGYGARAQWGLAGAARVAAAPAVVVVDVLSFTTSVVVAVDRGIRVYPHPWHNSARQRASEVDGALAVGRHRVGPDHPWSLSPAALLRAPATPRLVLPSPNGSTIAFTAAGTGAVVVAAGLRNATAVGMWLRDQGFGSMDRPVLVVAAGERWPDGTLRPCLEDARGAGAVLAALTGPAGPGDRLATTGPGVNRAGAEAAVDRPPIQLSPEAAYLRAGFLGTGDVAAAVTASGSGRELVEAGFAEDVAIAVELDATSTVPVLVDGAFGPG